MVIYPGRKCLASPTNPSTQTSMVFLLVANFDQKRKVIKIHQSQIPFLMHMFRHWRRPFSYHVLPVKPSYGLISHRSLVVRVLTAASSRRIFQWHTFPDSIEWCYWWFWKSGKLTSWGRLVVSPIYLTGVFSTIPSVVGLFRISETVKSKKMEGTDPTFAFRSWEGCNIFSVGQKVVRNETTTLWFGRFWGSK